MPHTGGERTVLVVSIATKFYGDRVWTPAEIDDAIGEDEDWRRYEIVDGVLIVSPHAGPRHELVVAQLVVALTAAVTGEYAALGSVAIALGRSYRVTDVTVVDRSVFARESGTLDPSYVLLAVEIESPTSLTTDRVTKPAQYAAAGIQHYWRVETDPLRLHTYELSGDRYAHTGEWGLDETAHIARPFEMSIEVAALRADTRRSP